MSNLKYTLKKIRNVKYKEVFDGARNIGKLMNKSTLSILFDMVKCNYKYGSGYTNYCDFDFYLLNDEDRDTFLTDRYYLEIIDKYNKKDECYKVDNRLEFYNLFKDFLGRDYINLKDVSYKEFKEFIINKDKIVVKSFDSNDGKENRVLDIDPFKLKNEYNVLKLYNDIMKSEQFLVEDYVKENREVSSLGEASVNNLNVISFISDNGKVSILSSILYIGENRTAFVNDDGKVYSEIGYNTVKDCVGFSIPNYDKLDYFIKELATKVSNVRYVSWNIVITEDGFLVRDASSFPKVVQLSPREYGEKTGELVKYREYMEI